MENLISQIRARETPFAAISLLLLAFCLYAGSFGGEWVYDDLPVIVDNPDVTSIGAFFENSFPGRPVREISYLLDHAFFGLQATGYHFQNILWHGLNCFLIFVLVRRLGGNSIVAWIASLLFLAHPIQVEVVAHIAHRKDSLVLFFSLLSILSYLEAFRDEERGTLWLLLAFGIAGIAFMTKKNAVLLPALFFLWEIVLIPPSKQRIARYKKSCFSLIGLGALAGFTWLFFFGGAATHLAKAQPVLEKMNVAGGTELVYIGLVIKSFAFMFSKLLLPFSLAIEYTYEAPTTWFDPWVALGLAILTSLVVALWVSFKKDQLIFFWLVMAGAFWLPVSNLWPLSYFAADRYLYAPSAGLFIALSFMLVKVIKNQAFLSSGIFILLALLSSLTWQQNRTWATSETLWRNALDVSPDSISSLIGVSNVHVAVEEYDEALRLMNHAVEVNPRSVRVRYVRAAVYEKMGDSGNAIKDYRIALKGYQSSLKPNADDDSALFRMGNAQARLGQLEEAAESYRRAIEINPDHVGAIVNLGNIYDMMGRSKAALEQYDTALSLDPSHAIAHFNRGLIYEAQGAKSKAIREYREALRLDPKYTEPKQRLKELLVIPEK